LTELQGDPITRPAASPELAFPFHIDYGCLKPASTGNRRPSLPMADTIGDQNQTTTKAGIP